ncbi:MAG: hypothetical protein ABIJ43_05855 [Candidatus Beckwithbacteria bacterium]|uniref:Uncharacterized protein n=1 Tax=viral metagenome TaxID=1070528 RepID=A0A6M3LDT5_9ZZZZ
MRLYATTTSERATKGQGGNQNILVVITAEINGNRQEIACMSVVSTDNYYAFAAVMPDNQHITQKVSKSEKQKGEKFECFHDKPCINCKTE